MVNPRHLGMSCEPRNARYDIGPSHLHCENYKISHHPFFFQIITFTSSETQIVKSPTFPSFFSTAPSLLTRLTGKGTITALGSTLEFSPIRL